MEEKKKDRPRTKQEQIELLIFTYVWMVTWFLAIWVEQYRQPLFLTGLFCFILGLLIVSGTSAPIKDEK